MNLNQLFNMFPDEGYGFNCQFKIDTGEERLRTQNKKLGKLLACPNCKMPTLTKNQQTIACEKCGESYSMFFDTPVLIKSDSPIHDWYKPKLDSAPATNRGFKELLTVLYRLLKPEDRVWSIKSKKALQGLLEEKNPDVDGNNVVLFGAGFESVYKSILKPYKNIIRMGLASRSDVEFFSDICDIPLVTDGLDLIFSSSILEHVYDPEQAVKEMFRVLKPGGYVYAEIPFMRSYHMMPVDYQRYTISGIEELFKRHGFTLINKGICSGPFTASVLFLIDLCGSFLSFNKYIKAISVVTLSLILHPIKYLDRFFEHSPWANNCACNFYYVGRKE